MCGQIKLFNRSIRPGDIVRFSIKNKELNGKWGLSDGKIYNARSEKLNGLWSPMNRGYLPISSFYENNREFKLNDNGMIIPILINPLGEFAIITRESEGIVKEYHHRMPVIIENTHEWLDNKLLIQPDYSKLNQII